MSPYRLFSILVVDDDENFLSTLSEILRLHSWIVDIASNGLKAVEMIKQKSYDLVLLDVRMPGINGIQTFNEIKKLRPETIVFLMTGGSIEDLKGIYTFIQKPINVSKITNMISNLQKKGNVLIIDDNENDSSLLFDIISQKNYNVFTAKSGREGIEFIKNNEFDIVLLDIRLPDMSGITVLEKIKEYKPAMPIIAITGYSLDDVIEKIISEGAYTCFIKPFNVELLLQEMDNIITKRERILQKEEEVELPKILIVEDDEGIRETTQNILQEEGFNVQTASSLYQAEEMIKKETFNMVISDLSLGGDSGLELVELTRNKDKLTVFILITGHGSMETALESIKKDVDEYILKPVKPEELIHKVKTYLEKQKLAKEKEVLTKQLQESNIRLLELSKIDELTGVFNRRHMFEQLHIEIQRAKRQDMPLTLMMCDVDGFKKYNDNYGHVEGDKILKEIAILLKSNVRQYVDCIFRYGGDEFVIIIPGLDKSNSIKVAERIISKVQDNFTTEGIGISIGVLCRSDIQQQSFSLNEIIDLTDKKLYEAKKLGGNKVVG